MELVYWGLGFLLLAIGGGFAHVLRPRHYVYLAVGFVALYTLVFLLEDTLKRHDGELWRVTIFMGSVLITIGWMVTNEILLTNNRKHHTINLITDYISGRQHIIDRKLIRKSLPKRTNKLTVSIVAFQNETHPLTQAIDRELNFFEFAAIGVNTGDLDYRIVRESIRSNLCSFYEQMEDYIDFWRKEDNTTWENLVALYRDWR